MSRYKFVPLRNRCPHGYEKLVCATCVAADKSAAEHARRQQEAKRTSAPKA